MGSKTYNGFCPSFGWNVFVDDGVALRVFDWVLYDWSTSYVGISTWFTTCPVLLRYGNITTSMAVSS